jgi:hypothetical protein
MQSWAVIKQPGRRPGVRNVLESAGGNMSNQAASPSIWIPIRKLRYNPFERDRKERPPENAASPAFKAIAAANFSKNGTEAI